MIMFYLQKNYKSDHLIIFSSKLIRNQCFFINKIFIVNYFFVILALLTGCLRDFSLIFNAARLSISSCDKGLRPVHR